MDRKIGHHRVNTNLINSHLDSLIQTFVNYINMTQPIKAGLWVRTLLKQFSTSVNCNIEFRDNGDFAWK